MILPPASGIPKSGLGANSPTLAIRHSGDRRAAAHAFRRYQRQNQMCQPYGTERGLPLS